MPTRDVFSGPIVRNERGQFLPGTAGNPGGRPSDAALLFRALTREVGRRCIPDERSRAEKLAELLIERAVEELKTPIVEVGEHMQQQQYTATKLLFSKLIPDRVAVKMYESSQDDGRPVEPAIDLRRMPDSDRIALIAIAQRMALTVDVSAREPSGGTHGQEEEEPG